MTLRITMRRMNVCAFGMVLALSVLVLANPGLAPIREPARAPAAIDAPDAHNPFVDATLTGAFETADGHQHWNVEGFCDSSDGSIFRWKVPHGLHPRFRTKTIGPCC